MPREQTMLKGHLNNVIHHQVYLYTKMVKVGPRCANESEMIQFARVTLKNHCSSPDPELTCPPRTRKVPRLAPLPPSICCPADRTSVVAPGSGGGVGGRVRVYRVQDSRHRADCVLRFRGEGWAKQLPGQYTASIEVRGFGVRG